MRLQPPLLLSITLAVLTTITQASNTLKLINHCVHPLYFWVIDPDEDPAADADWTFVAPLGGTHEHHLPSDKAAGSSMKMRDIPHYAVAPSGILQAEYNLNLSQDTIWYDLSGIDCRRAVGPEDPWYCPFVQGGVRMYVADDPEGVDCPVAECVPGAGCRATYLEHGHWKGEPSWSCKAGRQVVFETCVSGQAPRTICGIEGHRHDEAEWREHGRLPAPEVPVPVPVPEAPYYPPPPPPPPLPAPAPAPPAPAPASPEPIVPAPQQFPPVNLPPGTICYNEACTCYGTTQPWLHPDGTFPASSCPDLDLVWQLTSRYFDVPEGFPEGTTCYDEQCSCYSTLYPETWPYKFPYLTPDCWGERTWATREEYRCETYGECEADYWKR